MGYSDKSAKERQRQINRDYGFKPPQRVYNDSEHMSSKEFKELKQNKRQKYGNKKIETTYGTFDSVAEMDRYTELMFLECSHEIKDLQRQITFELIPKQKGERAVNYIADFVYIENGKTIVEDVKSKATAKEKSYIIKRKLFKQKYPEIEFREIKV